MRDLPPIFTAVFILGLGAGCSCSNDVTPPGGGDGPKGGGDGLTKTDKKVDSPWGNTQVGCSSLLDVKQCGDGKDNDGDKKIDAQDPECSGPCDNDESSFATGIPGDNVDACKQDCFFDGDSGSGNDKCLWDLRCDPKSPGAKLDKPCPYDPDYKNCPPPQTEACRTFCATRTPNGCDCFGCCQIFVNGKSMTVYLGSGPNCSTAHPEACASCTPVTSCFNDCKECELCLGKTISDLPATCFPAKVDGGTSKVDSGPPLPQCPTGIPPCLTNANCQAGYYCTTGCCIKALQ